MDLLGWFRVEIRDTARLMRSLLTPCCFPVAFPVPTRRNSSLLTVRTMSQLALRASCIANLRTETQSTL